MKIAIVGCGSMGLMYARTFIEYDLVSRQSLLLVEKNAERAANLQALNIGTVIGGVDNALTNYEIVFLCVKPQDFGAVAPLIAEHLNPQGLVVSIMAGVRIAGIATLLRSRYVIRTMPNLPAQLGMGITAYTLHPENRHPNVRRVENLLSATGKIVFLESEDQLDAVTALSGSGPAYFFYIVRAMIEAGKAMGLNETLSALLVKQTLMGSYHLMNRASPTLEEWIKRVASRGGTTEAALTTFEAQQLPQILMNGILAAENRAKALSEAINQPT